MEKNTHKKYPAGHWLGIGLAAGIVTGLVADILHTIFLESNLLWFGSGATLGLAVGTIAGILLENRKKHLRRELSPAERAKHKNVLTLTAMSVTMLVVVSVFLLLKKLGT
jgi:hypothetical protein